MSERPCRKFDNKGIYYYNVPVCGYGGIGRRARFRFWWETVQVQVLLSASSYVDFRVFTRKSIFVSKIKGFRTFKRFFFVRLCS